MTVTEKLKNVKVDFNKDEFKATVTNLNNVFVGSMIIAAIGLGVWLWKVFGIWLFVLPAGYVAMCYVGKFIRVKYLSHIKELLD
jgi:hypothetical protein